MRKQKACLEEALVTIGANLHNTAESIVQKLNEGGIKMGFGAWLNETVSILTQLVTPEAVTPRAQ